MKIRSVLQYAAPVFSSMLTIQEISDIERVKKMVSKVMLGDQYVNYEQACETMSTTTHQHRRDKLSLSFALSCLKTRLLNEHFDKSGSSFD